MPNQTKYLLANTPEAKAQLSKIRQLLEPEDSTNIALALQLLEAGGIPEILWNRLVALYWTAKQDDNLEEEILERFCQSHLADTDYQKLKTAYEKCFYYSSASKWYDLLENHFEEYFPSVVDKQSLANELLDLECIHIAKYCLEKPTMPALEVLKTLMDERFASLSLSDLELVELPKEIGQLTQLRHLYIQGNHFTELPDAIQYLTNLYTLDYASDGIPDENDTPLSPKAINKIKRFLPKLWSNKLTSKAEVLLSKNYPGYENAAIQSATAFDFLEEALNLDSQSCYTWTIKAAHLEQAGKINESLVCAQKALTINETFDWPRRILVDGLYKLKEYRTCITTCEPGINYGETIITPDYDDAWFLNHFRCSKAEALYQLEQWPLAFEAYKEVSGAWSSSFPKGLVTYHKACLYAWAQDKANALDCLEQAIDADVNFRKKAWEEPFFANYKQDSLFLQLMNVNRGEDDATHIAFV